MCNLADWENLIIAKMEKLMHYVWQHRLWKAGPMTTVDGRPVRVIDPGLLNTDAGPDFFNAKVEVAGQMWVGNVEMHVRASDWKRHGHDKDRAYDSVILHVVEKDDAPVYRTSGELIAQMVLEVAPSFLERYRVLHEGRVELPCAQAIASLPGLVVTEWVERLAFERLHHKVERLRSLLELYNGSWEDVCYVTLSRNLGFGVNNDAFERLARCTPLRLLHKHSDSLLQVEALLYGQAGLLERDEAGMDDYYRRLRAEYAFLRNKFSLQPLEAEAWKLFRLRPQNFPYRRLAMLAQWVHGGFSLMRRIIEAPDEKALRALFSVELTGYWAAHYTFDRPANNVGRVLGPRSVDVVLINTVAPLLYGYGEATGDYALTDRAVSLLESLRPEENSVVAKFRSAGLACDDALTSQALIELKREYCERRKCIYCKIGHHLLSDAARMGET